MARYKNNRPKKTYEWSRGIIDNIGVVSPMPYDIVFRYLLDKNLFEIVGLFFDNSNRSVNLLDQCILEQFWWVKPEVTSARYCQIEHPDHYSGEYIFDSANGERTIIEMRQPDIDGRHWRAKHLHIKRGQIDMIDNTGLQKPNFIEHIEITNAHIQGIYVMRRPS